MVLGQKVVDNTENGEYDLESDHETSYVKRKLKRKQLYHSQLSSSRNQPIHIFKLIHVSSQESMEMYYYCLLFVTSALQIHAHQVHEKQKGYRAAVIEYNPSPILLANRLQYQTFIRKAAQDSSCDIIIFPEATLTIWKTGSLIPNPEDKIVPYKNETYKRYKVVRAISKAAATNKIYVVVNLYELENCSDAATDCPGRGYFLYNTNVAFDRNGAVVARYRKYNLYDEAGVNKPKTAELSTFTTDFGVTFGMFICFDILFKSPTIDLVQKKNVTNLIFSTFWFGELPFLTAAQIQSGWSYAMGVNLLASGANKPMIGSTGSGIYNGQAHKISYMLEKASNVMIVGHVDDVNKTTSVVTLETGLEVEYTKLRLKQDPSLKNSQGKDLDPGNGTFEEKICHNGLCCRFSAKYRKAPEKSSANYTYRAVAFQGGRKFGSAVKSEVAYCAILLCTAGNCAKKPETGDYPIVFYEIKIDADFDGTNSLQMPSTLIWSDQIKEKKTLLQAMDYQDFAYERKGGDEEKTVNVRIELKKGYVGNIVTFGIYGRKFD